MFQPFAEAAPVDVDRGWRHSLDQQKSNLKSCRASSFWINFNKVFAAHLDNQIFDFERMQNKLNAVL